MKKRGFAGNWQNRRWVGSYSAYAAGANDPNIPAGGTGALPDYLTFSIRGTGYDYYYDSDDDRVQYESEKIFVSPVFITQSGDAFRFCVLYTRSSYTAQDVTGYFCIVDCDSSGRVIVDGSGDNSWESAIGSSGSSGKAYVLWYGASAYKWDKIAAQIPYVTTDAYNMMLNRSTVIYAQVKAESYEATIKQELLNMYMYVKQFWESEPLFWQDSSTSLNEIVSRAKSLSNYKYWYGGAGQVATKSLADSLRASYGGIWTQSYYNKALGDIGQHVADCSYLVNYAYGIASPGNHGIGTSQYLSRWSKWNGAPRNGMIVWRNGHTGIYNDGRTIEMVGIDYDYQEKTYVASKWSAILYDPNRTY